MAGFMKQISELIQQSDIILEILDARFPDKTRNKEIEDRIFAKGKKLIIVLNKMDLVGKNKIEEEKNKLIKEKHLRVVFVSAKEKNGVRLLKRELSIARGNKKTSVIGLLGYPNSGKSTIINSLSGKGKGKVSVSKKAGHTRGLQKIKISEGIYLLDAPGIIPYKEKDEFKLFLLGAKNANQLHDFETAALRLVQEMGIERINTKLGTSGTDEDEVLEQLAQKKNWFLSGGKPNTQKAAREILEMYQKNEL